MQFKDFLQIANYGNENWKGGFSKSEIEQNANDYFTEYRHSNEQGKATHTMEELCKLLIEDTEGDSDQAKEFFYNILKGATWNCTVYYCEYCRKREIVFFTRDELVKLEEYQSGNPRKLLIQDILPNCSKMIREWEREFRYCLCEDCWQKYWNGEIAI